MTLKRQMEKQAQCIVHLHEWLCGAAHSVRPGVRVSLAVSAKR